MPMFPRIDSPCPYKDRLASVMDGDFCRMCRRQVHDLTDMTDGERLAFLAACDTKVCVSYRAPVRAALTAAAIAASVAALPAAAQDAGPAAVMAETAVLEEIIVGGVNDPKHARLAELPADAAIPELPVVVETAQAATVTKPAAPRS